MRKGPKAHFKLQLALLAAAGLLVFPYALEARESAADFPQECRILDSRGKVLVERRMDSTTPIDPRTNLPYLPLETKTSEGTLIRAGVLNVAHSHPGVQLQILITINQTPYFKTGRQNSPLFLEFFADNGEAYALKCEAAAGAPLPPVPEIPVKDPLLIQYCRLIDDAFVVLDDGELARKDSHLLLSSQTASGTPVSVKIEKTGRPSRSDPFDQYKIEVLVGGKPYLRSTRQDNPIFIEFYADQTRFRMACFEDYPEMP